jgi:type IV secretory pathway VirD2 relaxase
MLSVFNIIKLRKWQIDNGKSKHRVSTTRADVKADFAKKEKSRLKYLQPRLSLTHRSLKETRCSSMSEVMLSLVLRTTASQTATMTDTAAAFHTLQPSSSIFNIQIEHSLRTSAYQTLRRQYFAREPTPTRLSVVSPGPVTRHITAGHHRDTSGQPV